MKTQKYKTLTAEYAENAEKDLKDYITTRFHKISTRIIDITCLPTGRIIINNLVKICVNPCLRQAGVVLKVLQGTQYLALRTL